MTKSSFQSYFQKLKDPRWQKRRLQIFERDRWKCQQCLSDEKPLHVHHLFYPNILFDDPKEGTIIRKAEPWEAPDEALITICEGCHLESTELQDYQHALLQAVYRYVRPSELLGFSFFINRLFKEGRIKRVPHSFDDFELNVHESIVEIQPTTPKSKKIKTFKSRSVQL